MWQKSLRNASQGVLCFASSMRFLSQVMSELWERGELCDVVLGVGCHKFPAHRVVLAGSSPYLRAMFTNGMQETSQPAINIHGIGKFVLIVKKYVLISLAFSIPFSLLIIE